MGFLSTIFGRKKKVADFLSREAIIVDVRSKGEYDAAAIPQSQHIPLQAITSTTTTIKKWNKPIICVCASGARSAAATKLLKIQGIEAVNGGAWSSVYKMTDH